MDHFLLGEDYRTAATRRRQPGDDPWTWGIDRDALSRARTQYRKALQTDPRHFWSHLQLGRCLLSLGQHAEAVEALGVCVAVKPDSPWSYSARGIALALCERFDEARRDLDRAIELGRRIEEAHHFWPARLNRGVVYFLQGQAEKALDDFNAVWRAPEEERLIEAAYYRGLVHLSAGKLDEALEDFDRVVRRRPGFREVYRIRAEVHFLREENGRGIDDLNTFLSLAAAESADAESVDAQSFDAESWQAYHLRGRWLLRELLPKLPAAAKQRTLALRQLAKTELQKAIDKGGDSPKLFHDMAIVLRRSGQDREALSVLSRGIELSPGDVPLLIVRGWTHQAAPDSDDEALDDFRKATALDPEYAEARTGLGFMRAKRGLRDDAENDAVRALLASKAGPQLDVTGAGDWVILHNVACIYAQLSGADVDRRPQYEDLAMDVIRREVELWQRGERHGPNALESIDDEAAFKPLRSRADFQELIRQP